MLWKSAGLPCTYTVRSGSSHALDIKSGGLKKKVKGRWKSQR